MSPSVTNADILKGQGDILRIVGGLEKDAQHAKESRGTIHKRLDEQTGILSEVAETLHKTQTALTITSEVATQARDEVLKLRTEVDRDVKPQLASVGTFRADAEPVITSIKNLRNGLRAVLWILGALGVLSAGTLTFANDYAKQSLRNWLDIEDVGPRP